MGNNFINNINVIGLGLLYNNIKSNNQTEDYKIKIKNIENNLKIFKEWCKKILSILKIPKKEKIREIFTKLDFTNEEILIIFGDKKIINSKIFL